MHSICAIARRVVNQQKAENQRLKVALDRRWAAILLAQGLYCKGCICARSRHVGASLVGAPTTAAGVAVRKWSV